MTNSEQPLSSFEKLASINCNERIEKKGNLSYLSWAWAVDALLRADPLATWDETDPPTIYSDGTMQVYCTVTAFGIARRAHLPVMDNRNSAIANPSARQISDSQQRCLVKAIALHGLGLYIYAGEDVPPGEPEERPAEQLVADLFRISLAVNEPGTTEEEQQARKARRIWELYAELCPETEFQLAVWECLKKYPAERSAIKKYKTAHEESLKTNGRKAA